jgi:hypothetical protein
MEHIYNNIVHQLRNIIIPPPANQLEMEFYYRRIISALEDAKQQIEDLQETMHAGMAAINFQTEG